MDRDHDFRADPVHHLVQVVGGGMPGAADVADGYAEVAEPVGEHRPLRVERAERLPVGVQHRASGTERQVEQGRQVGRVDLDDVRAGTVPDGGEVHGRRLDPGRAETM